MSFDPANDLALPLGGLILVGTLTEAAIRTLFATIKDDLGATTTTLKVRQTENVDGETVRWSLWVGHFKAPPSFAPHSSLRNKSFGMILVLEHRQKGQILLVSSKAGSVANKLQAESVSFAGLVALHADLSPEYEGVSFRSLRVGNAGIFSRTLRGLSIQGELSRVAANRSVPTRLKLQLAGDGWTVSPGTGRVAQSGGRTTIAGLSAWFLSVLRALEAADEPTSFIRAFAQPQALDAIGDTLSPQALQFDFGAITELLDSGWILKNKDEEELSDQTRKDLEDQLRRVWKLTEDEARNARWQIGSAPDVFGSLALRSTKLSLSCPALQAITAHSPDGDDQITLRQLFNNGGQFIVTFDDPKLTYAYGQLLANPGLVTGAPLILEMIDGTLSGQVTCEKAVNGNGFSSNSLFGHTCSSISTGQEYLVCEDMGSEWADFIGVSKTNRTLSFYHCKFGTVATGASSLHEVVSQALKNLGYLTATKDDLENKRKKWTKDWTLSNQSVDRLIRAPDGEGIADLIDAFAETTASPRLRCEVVLVVGGLSKEALKEAFKALGDGDDVQDHIHQVLWLLTVFSDSCRLAGAVPRLICSK